MADNKKSNRELFDEALKITDPAKREEFLAAECGEDGAQRRRVNALLKAFGKAGDFMDPSDARVASSIASSGGGDSTSVSSTEIVGTQIGNYKILQEIGEGGFGVVYMAEQIEPVRRRVALKIIKPGMDTRQVVARFEAERQALAMMSHPNISQALDAGATESGRPYFVMELVKGISITDFCDQNKLSTRQRLELFLQVCSAIQHAHQKGVVHRDIKPSNILVTLHDGKPVPKVIDFGIAKALHQLLTDKTLFTAYGQMIGTPQYTSPEQAEMSGLDIDTRSDIYSLGVLLYELLTGLTPIDRNEFKDAGFQEIQKLIREKEPTKPSMAVSVLCKGSSVVAEYRQQQPAHLISQIKGDLDWIVLKALEKDRSRRYATANSFAEDIGRYLRNEPVGASPPTMGYLIGKFARRHRRIMAATSAVFAALLIGAVGMTILFFKAESGRLEAERVTEVARQERQNADAARQLAQEYGARLKETFSKSDFAAASSLLLARDDRKALAYLARSLRTDPGFRPSAQLLTDTLRNRNFDLQPEIVFRHENPIESLELDPASEYLLTRSKDGVVRVWDAKSSKLLRTLGNENPLLSATFDPEGKHLVTLSAEGIVRVSELPEFAAVGRPIVPEGGAREIHLASTQSGGLTIATLSTQGRLRVWNGLTSQPVTDPLSLPEGTRVEFFRLNSTGNRLYGWGRSAWLGSWNTQTGKPTGAFVASNDFSHLVLSVEQGRACAIDKSRRSLRFFDLESGRKVNQLKIGEPVLAAPVLNASETRLILRSRETGRRGESFDRLVTHVIDWQQAKVVDRRVEVVFKTRKASRFRDPVVHLGAGFSASPAGDSQVMIQDIRGGTLRKTLTLAARLEDSSGDEAVMAFSPSGDRLAVNLDDHRFAVYRTAGGRRDGICERQAIPFRRLEFSPDGQRLVTVTANGGLQLWEVATGAALTPVFPHDGAPGEILFSADGERVFTTDIIRRGREVIQGVVRSWDVRQGGQRNERLSLPHLLLRAFEISTGNRVPLVTRAGQVLLLDLDTRQVVKTFAIEGSRFVQAKISRDDKRLVASSGREIFAWDLETFELEQRIKPEGTLFHIRLSEDGSRVFAASMNATVQLWDLESGRELTPPLATETRILQLGIRPDGGQLLAATGEATFVWDLRADDIPKSRKQISSGTPASYRAEYSSDGSRILFIDLNTARILDSKTGAVIDSFSHRFELASARFSPDGTRLLVCGPPSHFDNRVSGFAVVWDLQSRKRIVELSHDEPVRRARFSSDGRMVITLSQDHSLRIWDVELGRMLAQPISHPGRVEDFRISDDGQHLVSLCNKRAWIHRLPIVGDEVPDWLPDLAEAVAGQRIDDRGQIEHVPDSQLLEIRKELVGLSRDDEYGRIIRWFFADRSKRTLTPESVRTRKELVEELIARKIGDGLRKAMVMDPDRPETYSLLAPSVSGVSRFDAVNWQSLNGWYSEWAKRLLQPFPIDPSDSNTR